MKTKIHPTALVAKEALELKKALKILFASGLKFSTAIQKVKNEVKESPDIDHLLGFVAKSERGIPRSRTTLNHRI